MAKRVYTEQEKQNLLTDDFDGMGKAMLESSQSIDYRQMAETISGEALNFTKQFGISGLSSATKVDDMRSKTDVWVNGKKVDPSEELPMSPGFAYGTHLFKRANGPTKLKEAKKASMNGVKIFTEHGEALKTALSQMGVYSDRNPAGMPIDIKEAKKLWFGEEEPDGLAETEWRQLIENGDRKLDPKRVRKFTNGDGSITWEVLNEDKTVSTRFTMGDYAGTKLFSQGGYNIFAQLLKKAKEKLGPDLAGEFDSIRSMFGG